jgi:uncharacterized protein DUF6492
MGGRYSFVTVAHREDAKVLHLQARSLCRYLDRAIVAEIVVVENWQPGEELDWRGTLREELGDLAVRTVFLDAEEVAAIPSTARGWLRQQILKLMAARIVRSARYVILDAKNHLVFPLARGDLETSDGRMRTYTVDYTAHPMLGYLESALTYCGLDAQHNIDAFVPTTTPFAVPTSTVRELLHAVERRERSPFSEVFLANELSEFFLFGAYLLSSGRALSDFYELSGVKSQTIWPFHSPEASLEVVKRAGGGRYPFFAIHRRAVPKLDQVVRNAVADLWHRRALFDSAAAGLRFLSEIECRGA